MNATATKTCTHPECNKATLAKGLCRTHYDAARSQMIKPGANLDDLMDRISIALEIAGPEGLTCKQIREEVRCGSTLAYSLPLKMAEQGYVQEVIVKSGRRFVWVKPYPASE